MARTLVTTPHWELALDTGSIMRLKRSSVRYESTRQIEADREALVAATASFRCDTYGLITDMRQGPLSVDPAFERSFARLVADNARFACEAVVVATTLGAFRATRHGQASPQRSRHLGAFIEEAEALAAVRAWMDHLRAAKVARG